MPYSPGHVPQWTLELLAEDALPPAERDEAQAHVYGCPLCQAELEACRALAQALSGLPRFAPSPDFADAVMARVTLPQPAFARVRRWLPATRRGWMMLVAALLAPLTPLAVAVGWLLSRPMVTVGGLWSMTERWVSEGLDSLLRSLLGALVRSGAWSWGEQMARRTWELTTGDYSLVALFLALATPVAAWSLARLLRTPTGEMTHAH